MPARPDELYRDVNRYEHERDGRERLEIGPLLLRQEVTFHYDNAHSVFEQRVGQRRSGTSRPAPYREVLLTGRTIVFKHLIDEIEVDRRRFCSLELEQPCHGKPLVGGEWCEARHIGVVISGRLGALLRDGTVLEFGPYDVYDIPPGHDGYTIGDEPAVMIEWSGMRALAGAQSGFHDRVLATLLFTDSLSGKPALAVPGWFAVGESRVCLLRVGRLLLDTRAVAQCGLVHAVGAPVRAARAVAGADCEHQAGCVSRADDHMRLGRAVHEIPLSERALLALDDQQRLPGEHEEVLLIGLPVVHGHRLTRREGDEVDPQLRKLRLTLENAVGASPLPGAPARLARVEDEPAVPRGDESVFG